MSLDEASWHFGDKKFPADLPAQAGATHIGMFVAWAAFKNLLSESMEDDFAEALADLRHKKILPGAFVWQFMDGKLSEFDLSSLGMDFASNYYKDDAVNFLSDYEDVTQRSGHLEYRMPDDWTTYQAVADVIDLRYLAWKSGTLLQS